MSHTSSSFPFIRPFVSSTFKDMHAERDELIKNVFPNLRKVCEGRGVVWSEVDLRWGISDERVAEGKVLPICLEEIERCRPFFVCILGERYGSRALDPPGDLLERHRWLTRCLDRSVTELEIILGALRDVGELTPHEVQAFFYFRDPNYVNHLPPDKRADHLCDNRDDAEKLRQLKDRIRARFPVRENYRDAEQLGQWVEEDLTGLVNRLHPVGDWSDRDREAAGHAAFAVSRKKWYVPRPSLYLRLNVHAGGSDGPLVVHGEPGLGKSSLLANWADEYRRDYPQDYVLTHFLGALENSARWEKALSRIIAQLREDFVLAGDLPEGPEQLRSEFPKWLARAADQRRVVLVLDGLNQLEDEADALDLTWLPRTYPANVRVILSTVPGRPLDAATEFKWHKLELTGFKPDEVRAVADGFLSLCGKREGLSRGLFDRLVNAPQNASPLFLCVLLDEIRVHGDGRSLPAELERYLQASGPKELLKLVLRRYERDYEDGRPRLVRDAMRLLWAARKGLAEAELMDLLGEGGAPLPRVFWSRLALANDHALVNRSGLLSFSHAHIRSAVEELYLADDADKRQAHLALADYFETRPLTPYTPSELLTPMTNAQRRMARLAGKEERPDRRAEELPWQLAQAGQWQRLADLLAAMPDAVVLFAKIHNDALRYWAQIERHSPLRSVDVYRFVLDAPDRHPHAIAMVSAVLESFGHVHEVAGLAKHTLDAGPPDASVEYETALFRYVHYLAKQARFDEAVALCRDAVASYRAQNLRAQEATTLELLASIRVQVRDFEDAWVLYQEAAAIFRDLGDRVAFDRTRNDLASVLLARGELADALKLFKELEADLRREVNLFDLIKVLLHQADIYDEMGQAGEAEPYYAEGEALIRRLGDSGLLCAYYFNRGASCHQKNLDRAALEWYRKAEASAESTRNTDLLARCWCAIALIVSADDPQAGFDCLRKAKALNSKNLEITCTVLGTEAQVLMQTGRLDEADAAYAEAERVQRQAQIPELLFNTLANRVLLLLARQAPVPTLLEQANRAREALVQYSLATHLPRLTDIGNLVAGRAAVTILVEEVQENAAGSLDLQRQVRAFCDAWQLPAGRAYFVALEALRALRQGRTEDAFANFEAFAAEFQAFTGDAKGHEDFVRVVIYLVDRLQPPELKTLHDADPIMTFLRRKGRILKALHARAELVRCLCGVACLHCLVLDRFPAVIPDEVRRNAQLMTQLGKNPDMRDIRASSIGEFLRAADEADREATLFGLKDEQASVRQMYALFTATLEKQADRLVDAELWDEAFEVLEVRLRASRKAGDPAVVARCAADCAFLLAGLDRSAEAEAFAREATALARQYPLPELAAKLASVFEAS